MLPYGVQDLIDRKRARGICTFYNERPKQCPWAFVSGVTRRHRSNNLHGVLCEDADGRKLLFAKCLDEDCQRERRALTARNAKTGDLPPWGQVQCFFGDVGRCRASVV